MLHEKYYGLAAAELAAKTPQKDLFAKAYANAGGDAGKTKATYISMRAAQLAAEAQVATAQTNRDQYIRSQIALLDRISKASRFVRNRLLLVVSMIVWIVVVRSDILKDQFPPSTTSALIQWTILMAPIVVPLVSIPLTCLAIETWVSGRLIRLRASQTGAEDAGSPTAPT